MKLLQDTDIVLLAMSTTKETYLDNLAKARAAGTEKLALFLNNILIMPSMCEHAALQNETAIAIKECKEVFYKARMDEEEVRRENYFEATKPIIDNKVEAATDDTLSQLCATIRQCYGNMMLAYFLEKLLVREDFIVTISATTLEYLLEQLKKAKEAKHEQTRH